MSFPFERYLLGLFVPGALHPLADPEAATEHFSTSVGTEVSDSGIDTASVTRRHTEADTASSGGSEDSTGSTTGEFLGSDQQDPDERTPNVLSATPGSGDATPQVPLGSGSLPVYLLDRPSQSQALQGASTGSSLLGKRRRSDSPPDSDKKARKPRMKGRKGETEGFIPDWDIGKVYGLTTLVKRIGQTKMKAFLRSQGVDVDSMFPTSRVTYKGEKMTRGEAIAKKVQAVQAALIERRKATGLASSTGPSSSSFGKVSEVDEETDTEKAVKGEELYPEDSDSDEDGEFELENDVPETDREAEATRTTRQALKRIKEAMLEALGSKVTVLNRLGEPRISHRAQDLIASLVQCRVEANLVQSEGMLTSKAVSNLQLFIDGWKDYEESRSALVQELSSFIRKHFDVDARDIATQLVEDEFPVDV